MSADATAWVFRHSPATGAALTVHLAIADSVNDQHGYELWMRVPTLAEKARVHPGSVRRAIADLIAAGLLEELHDGRTTEDAGSATEARRFRFLMPSDVVPVWDPAPRKVREPRAHGAGTRAGDASTRAHGAGDLEPKVKPNENEPIPPNPPPASQGSLLPTSPPPAAREHRGHDLSFEAFWSAFPRKAGKADARKAWARAIRRARPEDIIRGAIRYRDDPNRPDEFTKWPQGWLNGDRWLDAPLPERSSTMNRTEQALRRISNEPPPDFTNFTAPGPRPLSIAAQVFALADPTKEHHR